MKKKGCVIVIALFVCLMFFLRGDLLLLGLYYAVTSKLEETVPKEYQDKFGEKEKSYHILSTVYRSGYPESFYRNYFKYDFVIDAFNGISNNIKNIDVKISYRQLNLPQGAGVREFTWGKVYRYRRNVPDKVKQIDVSGAAWLEYINNMYVFTTKGNYEVYFNDKPVFYGETNLQNYIFIKNEGQFYQICILEIYDEANRKQILERFESY
ncbi:MAG: hypothetical protein LBM02_09740 [Lachnospiraceae bacterium]|jgi:hypothetical protein|nr:hypothetical protein [Lachnospiraceae bacterium]